jgi:hypothetical protein
MMQYESRRPAAAFAIALLAAITAFCPSLLCDRRDVIAARHSCCPRPQHQPGPLPCDASSQTCPYALLERAKSVPPPVALVPPALMVMPVALPHYEATAVAPAEILPSHDLYLRNRVLLI